MNLKIVGNLPVKRAKDAEWFLQWCGVSLVSSYAVCFLQRGGMSLASSAIIYNIVKVKVTRWPVDPVTRLTHRPVDLFEKEPLKGNCEVHVHTPLRSSAVKGAELRLCSRKAKGAFCSCVAWGWRIYDIVESESDPLTRWPFRKRTPQGQMGGPPTYTHQVWRRSVKGSRRR